MVCEFVGVAVTWYNQLRNDSKIIKFNQFTASRFPEVNDLVVQLEAAESHSCCYCSYCHCHCHSQRNCCPYSQQLWIAVSVVTENTIRTISYIMPELTDIPSFAVHQLSIVV